MWGYLGTGWAGVKSYAKMWGLPQSDCEWSLSYSSLELCLQRTIKTAGLLFHVLDTKIYTIWPQSHNETIQIALTVPTELASSPSYGHVTIWDIHSGEDPKTQVVFLRPV